MTEINTSLVSDLTFIDIADTLRPDQWADWYVEFSYKGKDYEGSLQAGSSQRRRFSPRCDRIRRRKKIKIIAKKTCITQKNKLYYPHDRNRRSTSSNVQSRTSME